MRPLRLFVTGTDTGVGKTEVSCALLSLLADRGLEPVPWKPYESGCADPERPADALALRAAARSELPLEQLSLHRFRAALAPGIAARLEGKLPSFSRTLRAFSRFGGRSVVVEGAGGLRVPIDPKREVVDLIAALGLPVLLVARAGLGTLNHTALSLEALERRGIPVRAVVLVRSVRGSDPAERDNPAELLRRHPVPVLGPVPFRSPASTRRAAFRSALEPWLNALLA
jgi:dethiobiotin synthetase